MPSVPHKTCIRCEQSKPLIAFGKDRDRKDGYREVCKECRNTHRRATRNDQDRAHRRMYDVERLRTDTAYREKEQIRQRDKQVRRYHTDPQYRAAQLIHSRGSHPKRKADPARYKAWQEQCKRYTQRASERRAADPAYDAHIRAIKVRTAHRRRARIASTGGSYTAQEWRDLCTKYGDVCLCCGQKSPLTCDHIRPITKGGSNTIDNLQPLCDVCNKRKGTKTIDYRP